MDKNCKLILLSTPSWPLFSFGYVPFGYVCGNLFIIKLKLHVIYKAYFFGHVPYFFGLVLFSFFQIYEYIII